MASRPVTYAAVESFFSPSFLNVSAPFYQPHKSDFLWRFGAYCKLKGPSEPSGREKESL